MSKQKNKYKVKWKVSPCFSGEDCWCRIIEPEEPITYTYGFDNEGNHLEEDIILT